MKIPINIYVIFVFLTTLVGCTSFSYNNVSYPSRSTAFNAAKSDMALNVSRVQPVTNRLGGSALIVIPTREVIEKHGVVRSGRPSNEITSYIADVVELGFISMAQVVRNGALFDTVTLERSPNPENFRRDGFDHKIWLEGKSTNSWQWFIQHRNGKTTAIHMDSRLTGTSRLNSFNSSIAQYIENNIPRTEYAERSTPESSSNLKPVSSGTAFYINNNGFAITNAHVVSNCGAIHIESATIGKRAASIAAIDQQNDLALLKTSNSGISPARIRASTPIRLGENIVVFGFPLSGALASGGNLTTGVVSALSGMRDDSRLIQISAPVQPGNSGGPVFDEFGNVLGVVVSKLNAITIAKHTGDIPQNVNFAIKSSVVINFMETHRVSFNPAISVKKTSVADIGDLAKGSTYRVSCLR